MLVSRNWLQKYFEDELPEAQELADLLYFHSFEVEALLQVGDDWVIDVDVLPNRSSDCLSYRGIAREVSLLLSRPLKRDPFREALPLWEQTAQLSVKVEDSVLCPRYMAAIVRGVTIGPSPDWLKEALETIGQKSINNVVDATNYVMHNTGQPLHAFDFSLLAHDDDSNRAITVRLANDKESITTLTGETYELDTTNQVIADGISGAPLALAGIKGGKQAEITTETVDIILESANFNYLNVRQTSQSLKLATDASLRFQNEPSPRLPAFGLREAIELVQEIAGGNLVGVADVYERAAENTPVDVTLSEINALLGVKLTIEDVEKILIRFEWEFSLDGEEFAITGPWERTDIVIKEDVIEEIGRVYGYRNITPVLPDIPEEKAAVNVAFYYSEKIRHLLAEMGYSEVLTYTLREKGEVELENPFASDKAFMRMNVRNGMIQALTLNAQNAPLLGLDTVKLFEIGTIFTKKGEKLSLTTGVRAVQGKQSKADIALKEDMEKLFSALDAEVKIDVRDGICEIILDTVLPLLREPDAYDPAFPWDTEAQYTRWSMYPFMLRDIAVWVPKGTTEKEVEAIILGEATDLLVRHDKFDEFEKEDKVSYAWHLVFQDMDRTLTDDEMGNIMQNITEKLNARDGWEVR